MGKLKTSSGLCLVLLEILLLSCVALPAFAQAEHYETLTTRVNILVAHQKYAEALPIAENVLREAERDYGPTDIRVAVSLQNLALIHTMQHDIATGEPMALRSLAIVENVPSPDPHRVAEALSLLSVIYMEVDRFSEAEPYALKSLAIQQKSLPNDEEGLGYTLGRLATLYSLQFKSDKYGEAEDYFKRAVSILEKGHGPRNPTLSILLENFAMFYIKTHRYAEAVPLILRVISMLEILPVLDHREVLPWAENPGLLVERWVLGSAQTGSKQYANAEQTYQQILATEMMNPGPDRSFRISNVYDILSDLQHYQGKDVQAEESAVRAVKEVENGLGSHDAQIEYPLERLAQLFKDEMKYPQAEQIYKRLLGVTEQARPQDIHIVMILKELIKLSEAQGKLAESEPYHLRIIEFWDKNSLPDASIYSRESYSVLLRKLNREPEAAALDKQTKETQLKRQPANLKDSDITEMKATLTLLESWALQQGFGADYTQLAGSLTDYAAVLRFKGRMAEAQEIEARAQSMRDHADYSGPESFAEWFLESLDQSHPAQANVSGSMQRIEGLDRLAGLLRKVNRASDASKLEDKAAQIRSKTFSP
jgi:tetratricopeptide (TPR) repeat protein